MFAASQREFGLLLVGRDPDDVAGAALAIGADPNFLDREARLLESAGKAAVGPCDQTASTPPGLSAALALFNPAIL